MLRTSICAMVLVGGPGLMAQYTATVRTTTTKVNASSWQTWRSEPFVINHPSDWSPESGGGLNVPVIFYAPADSAARSREFFRLEKLDATGRTPKEVAAAQEERIRKLGGKFKASNTSTANDEGDIVLEYTLGEDSTMVHCLQHIHLALGNAWVMDYEADADTYPDHVYLAETMMASFVLKEEKDK